MDNLQILFVVSLILWACGYTWLKTDAIRGIPHKQFAVLVYCAGFLGFVGAVLTAIIKG